LLFADPALQALWLIANDARVQSKLRLELKPVFAERSRPDYRVLRDLKMLDCVMCAPYFASIRISVR